MVRLHLFQNKQIVYRYAAVEMRQVEFLVGCARGRHDGHRRWVTMVKGKLRQKGIWKFAKQGQSSRVGYCSSQRRATKKKGKEVIHEKNALIGMKLLG